MEEKNIALCILGVIAVIAIVGLILMFSAQKEGASVAAKQFTEYSGGVVRPVKEQPSYTKPVWQYSESSGEPVVEPAKLPYPPFAKTVE
ncbi:hypothetical protein KY310_04245 [Candidatus Woesearchaeota archaeon]|nr:hypothetical protein [Candidatus Woesearchaeota archaeon]